jgi:hypothetical protein
VGSRRVATCELRHWQRQILVPLDRACWTGKAFKEVDRELDAATTRNALDAAAKKLQRAKAELKRLKVAGTPAV